MHDEYDVSDLALASCLAARGYTLLGTKLDGKRMVFTFKTAHDTRPEKVEEVVLNFYNRASYVDALTYAETMRNLKSMIYQKKGG